MTEREKKLLLVDLCARVAFGAVKCQVKVFSFNEEMDEHIEWLDDEIIFIEPRIHNVYLYEEGTDVDISDIRPYLRPMSSMTEEEENEFNHVFELELAALEEPAVGHTIKSAASNAFVIDFYNRHHFDYRGLIEKGLALEAPKDMYIF